MRFFSLRLQHVRSRTAAAIYTLKLLAGASARARCRRHGLANFLEASDLAAAADTCRQSGVNGHDLLAFTVADLVTELRVTPFAARKIVQARDDLLTAPPV